MQTIIKKTQGKNPNRAVQQCNNGHICPTYMLLSPGIEPSPLRPYMGRKNVIGKEQRPVVRENTKDFVKFQGEKSQIS